MSVVPSAAGAPGASSADPAATDPAAPDALLHALPADGPPRQAPAPVPLQPPLGSPQAWPPQALALAEQLQRSLTIGDRDWHALKSQRARRGAEQIAAALVLLLARDQPAQRQPTQARQEAIALLEHALGWLKAELSDPGCPSHGR